MTLETSTLEIVANGSLAEDVNPRVLQPGSWLALENIAPDRGGEFRKRKGSYALDSYADDDDYVIDDAVNSCPLHVGIHADGPFCLHVSPQDSDGVSGGQFAAPPFIATYTSHGRWVAKDDVSPFLINRAVGLRGHQDFVGFGVVHIGLVTYTIGVPTVLETGVQLPIILRGVDDYTGAVVQDDLIVGYVSSAFAFQLGFTIRTMSTGGRVAICYCVPLEGGVDSGIVLTLYEPSTGQFGTATMVASRTGNSCPSIALPVSQTGPYETIVVAYGNGDTLLVREWRIGGLATGSFVTTWSYDEEDGISELEVSSVLAAGDIYVSYTVNTGEAFAGRTRTVAIHETAPNDWDTKWGPDTLDATHRWNFLTHGVTRHFVVTIGRDPSGTINDESLIYLYQNTLDGTAKSTQRLIGSLVPIARPAEWRGKLYLPTLARGDSSGGSPYVGALVHLRTPPSGHVQTGQPGSLVGTFAVGDLGTPNFVVFHNPNYCAPFENGGFQFATPILNGIDQSAVDVVRVESPDRTWLVPTTSAQGLTIIPGALTSYFDGQSVCELGFIEAPYILSAVDVTGEGTIVDVGEYLYTAVWEYYDATGLLHYSQPSPIFKHEVESESVAYVKLTILTDRIGRRASELDGERRPVRLVVYRTKANRSGPFYRLMSPTIEQITGEPRYNDYVVNQRYLAAIEFWDDVDDSEIDFREYGFFPFDANGVVDGRLNSDPPPPSRFALSHKSRVWLVSGDNPREVWFSQLMENGFAPMFSKVNRFYLSDTTEEIVALAPLADRVLIFTRNRIYAIDGDGPDNRGNGIPFREPYPFSLAVGCTSRKSVVVTNEGVAFLYSPVTRLGFDVEAQALYLVTQDLQVKRISGPAQQTLADYPDVRWSLHMPARGWVLWGLDRSYYDDQPKEAITLLWSYWTGAWVVWRTAEYRSASATVWRGDLVTSMTTDMFDYLYPRGCVYLEGGYSDPVFYPPDAEDPVPQWITMKLITPWLHPGAIASYSRTRRVQVFGEMGDQDQQCILRMVLRYGHRDEIGSEYAFPLAGDSHRGYPRVRVGAIPAVQKSAAIQVQLTDERSDVDSSPGPGVVLSAISLAIAGKKGLAKLSRTSLGRGSIE